MKIILVFTVFVCGQFSSPAQSVTITYLANEGVMISDGASKVLIDPFFKEDFKLYQTLGIVDMNKFLKQEPSLMNADVVLISHRHRDHFDAHMTARYLELNPKTKLISSTQVTDSLINFFGISESRISNLNPIMNKEIIQMDMTNYSVKAVWIRHSYESNYPIINLCFLVTMSGRKIFHLGDSELSNENFSEIDLSGEQIDVALVPFWYLASDSGVDIVKNKIHPKKVIAIHRSKNFSMYQQMIEGNFPTAIIFDQHFEKVVIPK